MYGESGSEKYKDAPKLCVDTSKLHIKGEPGTRSEASVTIQLELRPEIQKLKSDYEQCSVEVDWLRESCLNAQYY